MTAGTYTFTISDANQCSTAGSVTLVAPPPLQYSFSNLQNPTCYGSDDGSVQLNISGGIGNYTVSWDNGSFELNPTDLRDGYNEVRIYDYGRLVVDTGVVLTAPSPVTANVVLSDYNGFNVSCVDCFNGTINTNVTGGTAPYVFNWNDDPNITGPNRSNLNGGIYPVAITDANGCQPKGEVIIALTMPNPKDWSRFGNSNIDTSEFIGSTDTSAVVFKTNSQEALRLMGNGNVGVGTASPTEKLEVNGILKAQGLKLNNLNFKFHAASGNNPEKVIWGAEDNAPFGSVNAPVLPFNCLDQLLVNRFNIIKGAAVFKTSAMPAGCSNSDPTFYVGLLGCNGAIEMVEDGSSYSGGQTSNFSKLLLNTFCGRDVVVGRTDGGNLIVNHNLGIGVLDPNQKLVVDGNGLFYGSVGIGSVTPTAALHIKDGLANSLIIENTQSTNVLQIQSSNGASRIINSGSMFIYLNSDQDASDNSSEFIITKNASYSGQAGGTELFKIKNDGTAYLKDLWVKAPATNGAFPDYVFAKDYKLRSLAEVKAFYLKNHHLPDLPSATQIEAQGGVSMSELLIKLTKIVEENTIYLTQQDEQIKMLQAENLKLKKAIEVLTIK
jgi:hypothetical protein